MSFVEGFRRYVATLGFRRYFATLGYVSVQGTLVCRDRCETISSLTLLDKVDTRMYVEDFRS